MLTYEGGELAMYADTVSELLSAVIPGYDELPRNENGDDAAFVARYEAAIELANLVQTGLVIDATENNGWSPTLCTEIANEGHAITREILQNEHRRWPVGMPDSPAISRVPVTRSRT